MFRSVCAAYRRRVSDISPLVGENDEKGNDRDDDRDGPHGHEADGCGTDLHRTFSVRDGTRACQMEASAWRLYLRHSGMQPNLPQLMAPRAHLSGNSLKAIVLFARIRTR